MIQIQAKHKKIVEDILNKHKIEVYVFGSRAKGTARPLSDLDLCIKHKPEKSLVRKLQDDFEESDLPFKVDIIIWDDITDAFKQNIQNDLVLFTAATD